MTPAERPVCQYIPECENDVEWEWQVANPSLTGWSRYPLCDEHKRDVELTHAARLSTFVRVASPEVKP